MTGSEGELRREKILETLSKATKDGKEPISSAGTRKSPRNLPPESLELASTHRLIEGRNIGHMYDGKTSRGFNSRFAIRFSRY